ncbi:hypothetical protein EXIGLDRAFT_843477 [Exidia glandulosa HHB12029]|uniref:Zn(2)-C6 fungal-type domain-containing protein n=1 Tax=Exidia glandulosa HHB12029 TaxID=1314781 RepID=A0A165CLX4_EXIGL|nr:hypothetical protein EXIGLDRAFT_843477 [Exidia glandulosa HHB12029]
MDAGSGDGLRAGSNDGGVARRGSGRGPLSCAECRRLKLKCDRVWPCGPCQRRGCSAICPDGSLIPGKSNRFILADTKQLHERIEELSNRIRELEDALKASHAGNGSSSPHPLLRDELLHLKAPLQTSLELNDASKWAAPGGGSGGAQEPDAGDKVLGTLTIEPTSGTSSFFGRSSSSVNLLQNDEDEQPPVTDEVLGFPFTLPIADPEQARTNLIDSLPDVQTAWSLVEAFFAHAAWMHDAVPRQQIDDIFLTLYEDDPQGIPMQLQQRRHQRRLSSNSATYHQSPTSINQQFGDVFTDEATGTHDIALFYVVLAVGVLVSPAHRPFAPEAERYHSLSRAALALEGGVMDEIGLTGIQTLVLMCFYLSLSDRKNAPANSWAVLGLSAKLSQSIGLHRDSGKWNLDPPETQRRRTVFWELFTIDQLQSLGFGRPPSFALSHVDCEQPAIGLPQSNANDAEQNFHLWKFGFARQVLSELIEKAFGAKPPPYQVIYQLDKLVRDYPIPPNLVVNDLDTSSLSMTMQRHAVQILKETSVLYLHRSFFARAVTEHPSDALTTNFTPSVHATVQSAMTIVDSVNALFNLQHLTARFWFFWTHAFSASMVLGSYVARMPGAQNAHLAMQKFDIACTMFHKASTLSAVAGAKALPIMLKLQSKARTALQEWHNAPPSRGRRPLSVTTHPQTDEDIALLGKTTIVYRRPSPSPNRSRPVSRSPSGRSRNLHGSRNNSPLPSPGGFDGFGVPSPAASGSFENQSYLTSPGGMGAPSPGSYRQPSPGLTPGGLRPPSPGGSRNLRPPSPGLTPTAANYSTWQPASHFLGVDDAVSNAGSEGVSESSYSSLANWSGQRAPTPRAHSRSRSEHISHSPTHGHGHGHSHSISGASGLTHSMSLSAAHNHTMNGNLSAPHPNRAQTLPQVSEMHLAPPPRIRTPQPDLPQHQQPQHAATLPIAPSHMMQQQQQQQQQHPMLSMQTQSMPVLPTQTHMQHSGLQLQTGMSASMDSLGVMQGVGAPAMTPPSPISPFDEAYLATLMGGRYEPVGFPPGDQSLDAQWGKFVTDLGVHQF